MPPITFPQTAVSFEFSSGQLGQPYNAVGNAQNEIHVKPALLACSPGDILEQITDATTKTECIRPAQSLNAALKDIAGVALYKSSRQPVSPPYTGTLTTGYKIGDMVPYMRKGKIYAKWLSNASAAQVSYSTPNYAHSSTTPGTSQGAFTDKATLGTVGSEVDTCPTGVRLVHDVSASLGFTICLVELNLP